MNISIIGTGYVGLVTGTCFAELGNNVVCLDIDKNKIENLKKGISPIYEPGLEELLERNQKEKRLEFTTDTSYAIQKSEVIFSAVGTPPDKNHQADLSHVCEAAISFSKNLNGYKIFVNKSTVPVGTSFFINDLIKKNCNQGCSFGICYNPEFLREGSAIKDFMQPDRIIIGVNNDAVKEIMMKLYHPLIRAGNTIVFTDIASAEIIKYASNAFLATKISFINEIANFCEIVGADVKEVARGIGLDQRIGPRFLHAGIGYGGSCFPKDVKAFIETAKQLGAGFKILEAVEEVNQKQKIIALKKLKTKMPDLKGKKIAVWGLSFKPKTDDMREAPSLSIIKELFKSGCEIHVFDPVAIENAKKIFADLNINYHEQPLSAVKEADALLILTEWDEFRAIDLNSVKMAMRGNILIDGRNIYESSEMLGMGFDYDCIGRIAGFQKTASEKIFKKRFTKEKNYKKIVYSA